MSLATLITPLNEEVMPIELLRYNLIMYNPLSISTYKLLYRNEYVGGLNEYNNRKTIK